MFGVLMVSFPPRSGIQANSRADILSVMGSHCWLGGICLFNEAFIMALKAVLYTGRLCTLGMHGVRA